MARPTAVFPQLESVVVGALHGHQARKLVTLIDRGAFPSLASLRRPAHPLFMHQGSAADTAQHVALLHRLPAMEALELESNVAPFAELITSGGLPNLKSVSRLSGGLCVFVDITWHLV